MAPIVGTSFIGLGNLFVMVSALLGCFLTLLFYYRPRYISSMRLDLRVLLQP
jgi:hypothetical protein